MDNMFKDIICMGAFEMAENRIKSHHIYWESLFPIRLSVKRLGCRSWGTIFLFYTSFHFTLGASQQEHRYFPPSLNGWLFIKVCEWRHRAISKVDLLEMQMFFNLETLWFGAYLSTTRERAKSARVKPEEQRATFVTTTVIEMDMFYGSFTW